MSRSSGSGRVPSSFSEIFSLPKSFMSAMAADCSNRRYVLKVASIVWLAQITGDVANNVLGEQMSRMLFGTRCAGLSGGMPRIRRAFYKSSIKSTACSCNLKTPQATMADPNLSSSSRIFVKGLPPTFNDAEFRKHFSRFDVTDCKIFPSRRIGYVGYRSPEEAQKAVKYFNKTFIRMSKIGVELARPPQSATPASTALRASDVVEDAAAAQGMKRKRDPQESGEQVDPKLKEFLEVMKPKSKNKTWRNEATEDPKLDENVEAPVADGQSDDEYEQVPKKVKLVEKSTSEVEAANSAVKATSPKPASKAKITEMPNDVAGTDSNGDETAQAVAVSDADWARSRTSRLLGLLDEDEEEAAETPTKNQDEDDDLEGLADLEVEPVKGEKTSKRKVEAAQSIPTPPSDNEPVKDDVDPEVEAVPAGMRLFVRNLPYDVKEEDLEAEFKRYGNLEEVG